jgi:hypothetical protein
MRHGCGWRADAGQLDRSAWGPFYETVSAQIYGLNLICSILSM